MYWVVGCSFVPGKISTILTSWKLADAAAGIRATPTARPRSERVRERTGTSLPSEGTPDLRRILAKGCADAEPRPPFLMNRLAWEAKRSRSYGPYSWSPNVLTRKTAICCRRFGLSGQYSSGLVEQPPVICWL